MPSEVIMSYQFFKMAAMESEIYFRVSFSNITRLGMSKSTCTLNFDEKSHFSGNCCWAGEIWRVAVLACVWRATTKKRSSTFKGKGKKCTPRENHGYAYAGWKPSTYVDLWGQFAFQRRCFSNKGVLTREVLHDAFWKRIFLKVMSVFAPNYRVWGKMGSKCKILFSRPPCAKRHGLRRRQALPPPKKF